MKLSPKFLIKILEQPGFVFKRTKGSHQLFYNPVTNTTAIVTVNGGKDMKKDTFLAIVKQAGIDKNTLD